MASYLSVTNFLTRSDIRSVGRLCSRTGTGLNAAQLSTDTTLAAALLDASGEVLAACLQGDRYTELDLQGLTDKGQAKLYRLLAQLTVCLLWENQQLGGGDLPQPAFYEAAYDELERLRQGQRVFAV